MRISSLSMIGVIKAFHAYSVSRGTDTINHFDGYGHASFKTCAVGEFAKFAKTPLSADDLWRKYMQPAIAHYQIPVDDSGLVLTRILTRGDLGEQYISTYDKLAKALGQLIK